MEGRYNKGNCVDWGTEGTPGMQATLRILGASYLANVRAVVVKSADAAATVEAVLGAHWLK